MSLEEEKCLKEVMDVKEAERKLQEAKAVEYDKMNTYLNVYLERNGYKPELYKGKSGLVRLALALTCEQLHEDKK